MSLTLNHQPMSFKFITCLICQLFGFLWFLKGFFPRKATLTGFSEFGQSGLPFLTDSGPQFGKLIFVVVDAMRSDFMFSSEDSHMPFLHSLINNGSALPFTAFSHPPTVTLPRLKGLTTGGTPSFIDAILNIADDNDQSQGLENEDSWVYQLRNLKGKQSIHFFGDDTWLKLFPAEKFFDKFEGTSSFFVSDFTEVDTNVTRHLLHEINDNSWDALILHYLGLDHIGHKGGPDSIYMAPKQAEMDQVLKELCLSRVLNNNNTLLVLLGDHGMNEIGNHGGASAGETSPGLILVSPKFSTVGKEQIAPWDSKNDFKYYDFISQIDIVPTLAALFDFPIPKNSLGIILPQILGLWGEKLARRQALLANCEQFMGVLAEKYGASSAAFQSFNDEYSSLCELEDETLDSIYIFLRKVQATLIEEATNYSYVDIVCGICVILLSTVTIWLDIYSSQLIRKSTLQFFFAFFCIFYALHFHGSSLIEEEHQIWWFMTVVVIFFHLLPSRLRAWRSFALALFLLRVIRGWNNSGQKITSNLTISSYLSSRPELNWTLVIMTYLMAMLQVNWDTLPFRESLSSSTIQQLKGFMWMTIALVVSSLSFAFKLNQFYVDGHEIPPWLHQTYYVMCICFDKYNLGDKENPQFMSLQISRLFFFVLVFMVLSRLVFRMISGNWEHSLHEIVNSVTLLLIHQTRLETIPIFIIFAMLKVTYMKLFAGSKDYESCDRAILLTMFILCVQHLTFFSVGNTNLLATIDLSNAYNGVSNYNIISVGILTFVSNFAVAIYWSLAIFEIAEKEPVGTKSYAYLKRLMSLRASLNLAFYSISALSLVGSCVNLRFHLFIWSVFSPKLLYFGVWFFMVNTFLDCALIYPLQFILLNCSNAKNVKRSSMEKA